jgi:hypothetical protein
VKNGFISIKTTSIIKLKRKELYKVMVNRKVVKVMFTMHFPLNLKIKYLENIGHLIYIFERKYYIFHEIVDHV